MLFDSSVRRDLARTFAATMVVILTIVITIFLIRTLRQAAGGAVAPQDVVLLLGFAASAHLATMMCLSMFVAVVITLGRMYRDSEMVIWFASGIGLPRFVRPVLWTALPVVLMVAAAMLFLWPWVNQQSLELRERYTQRSDLSRVSPGVFQSSSDGRRVFFVERESPDGINARNVFILSRLAEQESVISARSGRLENDGGSRFLVLEQGQQNLTDFSTGEHTVSRFEHYRVLADDDRVLKAEQKPARATATLALLAAPTAANQGELAWRLGMVMADFNLLLLGIALSATNPRRPGNWNLIFALLAFIVYFNLVSLSQNWVASGRVGLGASLLALHGGALVLAVGLIAWRDRAATMRWWPLPRRRRAPA
ncbi:MAG: LPS export ABC transporter permease LptF [Rubrivivax sp.]